MILILLILSFSLKTTASLYFPFFLGLASIYAAGVEDSHLPFCELPLYNYLQRNTGIIKSSYSEKRLHVLEALENRIEFTKQNRPQFERDAIMQYMKICILCYYRVKFAKLDSKHLDNIKQKLDGYYKQGYTDKYVKLFYKAPWLFEKLLYIKLKLNKTI